MPSSAFPLLSVPPPFPYTTLFRSSFLRRFADRGGWYKAPAQRIKELLSVRGRHRQQQSARSLRIVEQVSDILRDTVGEFDALRNEFDVALEAAGQVALARALARAGQELNALVVEDHADMARYGHLARVAEKPEAGDVGGRVNFGVERRL